MTPTARAAFALLAVALAAIVIPPWIAVGAAAAVVVATIVDAGFARRRRVRVRRTMARNLSRGVSTPLTIETDPGGEPRVVLRQAQPPDVRVVPSRGRVRLDAQVVALRRGEHALPPVAARRTGPLGLGACTFDGKESGPFVVYPDVDAAHRMVSALRQGRFRDPGLRTRGPLGLGTDFESIRDYQADDDVRQINWSATARTGRAMSNVYRVEQDREVVCLVDAGRLMTAPLETFTRLDAVVDAVTMLALVADELGDRCGLTVFDREIHRRLAPRRSGGRAVVEALVDVEPRAVDSDYDLAFRSVGGSKRSLVIVLTDLVDEAAARSLVDSVPVLARRHAVVVASVRDPDLDRVTSQPPTVPRDVYASAVALDVLSARQLVETRLRRHGAEVVEAAPAALGTACVRAYLRLKSRARI
jgi:uncharacterized protein (DUF58 family)